jgi:hypothetical protein
VSIASPSSHFRGFCLALMASGLHAMHDFSIYSSCNGQTTILFSYIHWLWRALRTFEASATRLGRGFIINDCYLFNARFRRRGSMGLRHCGCVASDTPIRRKPKKKENVQRCYRPTQRNIRLVQQGKDQRREPGQNLSKEDVTSTEFSVLSTGYDPGKEHAITSPFRTSSYSPRHGQNVRSGRLVWSFEEDRDKGGIDHQNSYCHHGTSNWVVSC